MVKTKVSDWVDRNFFSLAVFGGNLLAGDVHSSVAMDSHVQACQWTGSISLLTWGLLWASAYSLEVWGDNGIFLLLMAKGNFPCSYFCQYSYACWRYKSINKYVPEWNCSKLDKRDPRPKRCKMKQCAWSNTHWNLSQII